MGLQNKFFFSNKQQVIANELGLNKTTKCIVDNIFKCIFCMNIDALKLSINNNLNNLAFV